MEGLIHLASWWIFAFILAMVMLIARFYEKKSGQRTLYQLYIIPIILFISAGVAYSLNGSAFVGDKYGDLFLTGAGLLTVALVGLLYTLMMGKH